MLERLKRWAAELNTQLLTLWFCRRHPDTPWTAKAVLGYLDDLIIVPPGICLALRLGGVAAVRRLP